MAQTTIVKTGHFREGRVPTVGKKVKAIQCTQPTS